MDGCGAVAQVPIHRAPLSWPALAGATATAAISAAAVAA